MPKVHKVFRVLLVLLVHKVFKVFKEHKGFKALPGSLDLRGFKARKALLARKAQ